MRVTARPFADLVYHVLAHVPGDAAASAWDPIYAAWSEAQIGPASNRPLAEDARALAALAPTHDALVRAQIIAWLFSDPERARPFYERALSELRPEEVDDPAALKMAAGDPAAELLWCAVALEDEAHAKLRPMKTEAPAALEEVAPNIREFDLGIVRSLRLRGRVYQREIWVGEPGLEPHNPTLEHVAWQAAHEAAAVEIAERSPGLPFASVEHGSVVLLAVRAERAGRAADHARWLSSLRAPDPRLESLSPELRALVLSIIS
jgi:hypothetical protein